MGWVTNVEGGFWTFAAIANFLFDELMSGHSDRAQTRFDFAPCSFYKIRMIEFVTYDWS